MKTLNVWLITALMVAGSFAALAQESEKESDADSQAQKEKEEKIEPIDYLFCRLHSTIRTVRVVRVSRTDEEGDRINCETVYTKWGKDQVIGAGRWVASCHRFLNNIKKNLESAEWSCRDVSQSKITVSKDLK